MHVTGNPPGGHSHRRWLSGVEQHLPHTVFSPSWDENRSPARNQFTKEFFTDPLLLYRAALLAHD